MRKLLFLILLSIPISLFSVGIREPAVKDKLEDTYTVYSIPLGNRTVVDYSMISDSTAIFSVGGPDLFLIYLKTGKKTKIKLPDELKGENIQLIQNLKYQNDSNSLHMIGGNKNIHERSYFILHLDDMQWEEIPALRGISTMHYYDPVKNIIYYEDFSKESRILVFDMTNHEKLEPIAFPENMTLIHVNTVLENPLVFFTNAVNRSTGKMQYYYFDPASGTGVEFQEVEMHPEGFSLEDFNPLSRYDFLCLNRFRKDESGIVEFNLMEKSYTMVDEQSYQFRYLKKISDGKYSFIVNAHKIIDVLCILDY